MVKLRHLKKLSVMKRTSTYPLIVCSPLRGFRNLTDSEFWTQSNANIFTKKFKSECLDFADGTCSVCQMQQ